MRMKIENIDSGVVIGNTDVGVIKGIWCGKENPEIGETYFFELNIADIDVKDLQVIGSQNAITGVSVWADNVKFTGVCENIDDIYVVRFSNDWIEMISFIGESVSIEIGDTISFSTSYDKIEIYPY